jgi:hypothetical protein
MLWQSYGVHSHVQPEKAELNDKRPG